MSKECDNMEVFVLDGGLATELECMGFNIDNPLWGASILHKNPEAILKVHNSYLEHGANIITTASYQASIPGFQKHLNLNYAESYKLLKLSVELAQKAKEEYQNLTKSSKKILIAGSIGPYGASLADGSEYNGNYCDTITYGELIEWHRPHIQCLIDAGVKVLAFETIPALKEAECLMRLLKGYPSMKAWLSFSSQSLHETSHKEDISTAVKTCLNMASASQLIAIGINCCAPENVFSLLSDISTVSSEFPLIVYPNNGDKWEAGVGWIESKSRPLHSYLDQWLNFKIKIIGGCCRTHPEDILEIYKFLQIFEYIRPAKYTHIRNQIICSTKDIEAIFT